MNPVILPGFIREIRMNATDIDETNSIENQNLTHEDEELDRTTWWMLSDSQLSEHQLEIATEWRADMMAVTSLESFTAMRSEFIRLVSIKPNWSI